MEEGEDEWSREPKDVYADSRVGGRFISRAPDAKRLWDCGRWRVWGKCQCQLYLVRDANTALYVFSINMFFFS